MSLRAVFSYQNLDSTADLNLRFEKLVSKGVFYGGSIAANGTTNTVTVNPFRAATFDGMVVLDTASTSITVTGNQKSYICLLAMYNTSSNPTMNWVVHTQATYNADPNRDYLICFGTVDLSGSAGPVFSNLVSYQERNIVSLIGRDGFLGTYSTPVALQSDYPSTAPVLQHDNDVALVAQGVSGLPTWYRWDNTSGAFVAFGTYADDIASFTEHINEGNIHVSVNQKAALAGTSGDPSSGNKFVTESDTDRTLATAERAALSNAVGAGSGISASNPIVADGLAVVSQVLIQKIADGSNVVALTAASFGDIGAVLYVGRQGVDGTGKSSASQYFSLEDLFGDGLSPIVGGVESPVTITNIGWNAPTGSVLNPASNAQVDSQGFLTIQAGQTLYININVNLPTSTQYNVRLNVKGRVRDLAPTWGNPTSFPVRAAATAFRNGRQPFVIANTGDFKSFRVGDSTKASLFFSADQTGYPSYGSVSIGAYAGATLKGLLRLGAGTTGAFDMQNDTFYARFGISSSWASVFLFANATSDSAYFARNVKGVPNTSEIVTSRAVNYILDNETGVLQAGVVANTIIGANPAFSFVGAPAVGLGMIPTYTLQDQGGSVTYSKALHLRAGAADLTNPGHFDVLFVRNPESTYESEADVAGSVLIFHKSSSAAESSVTYTLWASGSNANVLALASSEGRAPNPSLFVAPVGTYTLPGVENKTYSIRATESVLLDKALAVGSTLLVKGVLKTYSGLNTSSTPAISINTLYNGALYVAGALTPTTSLIRVGTDTLFGTALYACSNTSELRASLVFGVSDMQLLGNASNFGSVRLGPTGYQLMWSKETPSSAVCPHVVIEEAADATRELLIGRRGYNGGSFDYTTAIRIKSGVIDLPFVSNATPMLSLGGGSGSIGLGADSMLLDYGGHVVSITETELNVGQAGSSGAASILAFSGYGKQTMLSNIWVLNIGTNPNDAINFGGVVGQMALYPNVTGVTDLGTPAKLFHNVYTATVVTPNFSVDYLGSVSPRANNVGTLGASAYRFAHAYVTTLDSINFGNAGITFAATGALPTVANVYSIGSSALPIKSVVTNTMYAASPRSGYRTGLALIDPGSVNKTIDLRSGDMVRSAILSVVKTDGVTATALYTDHYVTLPVPSADYLGAELEVLIMFHQNITGSFGIKGLSSLDQSPYVTSLMFTRAADVDAGCALYTFKCINALVSGGRYAIESGEGKYSWICLSISSHHTYS